MVEPQLVLNFILSHTFLHSCGSVLHVKTVLNNSYSLQIRHCNSFYSFLLDKQSSIHYTVSHSSLERFSFLSEWYKFFNKQKNYLLSWECLTRIYKLKWHIYKSELAQSSTLLRIQDVAKCGKHTKLQWEDTAQKKCILWGGKKPEGGTPHIFCWGGEQLGCGQGQGTRLKGQVGVDQIHKPWLWIPLWLSSELRLDSESKSELSVALICLDFPIIFVQP